MWLWRRARRPTCPALPRELKSPSPAPPFLSCLAQQPPRPNVKPQRHATPRQRHGLGRPTQASSGGWGHDVVKDSGLDFVSSCDETDRACAMAERRQSVAGACSGVRLHAVHLHAHVRVWWRRSISIKGWLTSTSLRRCRVSLGKTRRGQRARHLPIRFLCAYGTEDGGRSIVVLRAHVGTTEQHKKKGGGKTPASMSTYPQSSNGKTIHLAFYIGKSLHRQKLTPSWLSASAKTRLAFFFFPSTLPNTTSTPPHSQNKT